MAAFAAMAAMSLSSLVMQNQATQEAKGIKPPPPVRPPTPELDLIEQRRRRAAAVVGRQSTNLTGGLTTSAPTQRKTLLGL